MSEPEGRGADWTEERGARNERTSDEGSRRVQAPRRRKENTVRITDSTLRDGSHAMRHQFTEEQVRGNGDYLPDWAGNLDIMTAAAARVGELLAIAKQEGASA